MLLLKNCDSVVVACLAPSIVLVAACSVVPEAPVGESTSMLTQKGQIDPSFNVRLDEPQSAVSDPSGNLYVSGSHYEELAERISADGQQVTPFHRVPYDGREIHIALARLKDGRILVASDGSSHLSTYRPDGTKDALEADDIFPNIQVGTGWGDGLRHLAAGPDGSFYVAGQMSAHQQIVKYRADGSRDLGWADRGIYWSLEEEGPVTAISVQNDGRVLWSRDRLNRDGSLDEGFRTLVAEPNEWPPQPAAMLALSDGGFVALVNRLEQTDSYEHTTKLTLKKYLANDTLDTAWGDHGLTTITLDEARVYEATLAAAPDGRIVLATRYKKFGHLPPEPPIELMLASLSSDGKLDPAFGANGLAFFNFGWESHRANFLTLQPDAIIMGGYGWNGVSVGTPFFKRIGY